MLRQNNRQTDYRHTLRMTPQLSQGAIIEAFQHHFDGRPRLFRAPGRVNVIGEHTDYNDGFVMPINADLHTWVAVVPRDDRTVRALSLNFDEFAETSLDDLRPDPQGGWIEYVKGVLYVLQDEGFEFGGADMLIAGELPLRSGLSSSAALETGVGYAVLACAGHDVDRTRLARMCQRAENDFVGMSCGIMDQFVISSCRRGYAMYLDCRSLEYTLAPLPEDARLLIVHSGVHRQLVEGGYNDRRQECEQATAALAAQLPGIRALRDVDAGQLEAHRDALNERLYRRARHVVTEDARVGEALAAMQAGDVAALGRAITASHASLRDDFEVSCADVDTLVEIALSCDGVYGSRMVGGGFGGCTITLVDAERADDAARDISDRYAKMLGETPWFHLAGPTGPVDEVEAQ